MDEVIQNSLREESKEQDEESDSDSDDDSSNEYSTGFLKDSDEKIDKVYQRIVKGETFDLDDELSYESYDKLFEKLKIHEDDSNCMYHAGCCLEDGSKEGKVYLEKAAKLGNCNSCFVLANQKFLTNKEQSLEEGVSCLEKGFKYPYRTLKDMMSNFANGSEYPLPNFNDYPPTGLQYYCFVLEHYVEKLKSRIETLEK